MPGRRRSTYAGTYSSYGRRDNARSLPSPLPYLLLALIAGAGLSYYHFFAFKSLSGRVVNGYTGKPLSGVTVVLESADIGGTEVQSKSVFTATSTNDGEFSFDRVPNSPVISARSDGFTPARADAAGKASIELRLLPDTLFGRVTGSDGKPIKGATIFAGASKTRSGADGTYQLQNLPQDRRLVVKAAGYLSEAVQFGQVAKQDISLVPFIAKAIYINADSVATPAKYAGLLDLLEKTELNAVVIDVKADNTGQVLYDSKLALVTELGTQNPIIPELDRLLADLKSRKIYSIARLSVFWDQAATTARPTWALHSKKNPGKIWVDGYGKRWTNPYNKEARDYNLKIALEVASRGFSEVQFDNVQFPSDGDLDDIDFGPDALGKKRVDAIATFLDDAYTILSPTGTYISADVFGLTPYVQDDMGIGQHFEDIASRTDYVSPAIYPSHFGDGFMGFPSPADHPFEIVSQTAKSATARLSGGIAQLRPWLQDFSGKVSYDAAKVRAEIDAAEANGAVGWMLWNFGNSYTSAALRGP